MENRVADQGFITDDMLTEYLRWLYTAVTRATENFTWLIFTIGFWGWVFKFDMATFIYR